MNYDLSCFSNPMRPVTCNLAKEPELMFVISRSPLAVLLPLALLLGVAVWSNRSAGPSAPQSAAQTQQERQDQTVAANLPSR
jgi:hypothetical protein